MAGVYIEISGDALESLQLINKKSAAPDDILDDIGAYLDMDVTTRFLDEMAPDGTKWIQSEAARTGKGRNPEKPGLTLTDTRDLVGSVTHNADNGELEHGLGEVYSAIHHFGGKTGRNHAVNLPARPIIGIEQKQASTIVEMVSGWLV
ncbi:MULTISPECIES: phage virion morphogenesis protein [Pseudoalteromonas]|uniref:Phage virion morphogenesis protein n=1 Tax=Pseudoalteromonas amylolytica TaxID=1859457 RepID=A0A1S1N138_9GAMM|nr:MULTISPECIES: phage virion morphogenesis protein [Pseudoalteromonas]OHU85524.1 phage virion morphogenesis protein [Pseudoalteromonas sp. JW3]OHU91758.1 phage virion morphogenesis protein [Pseudoalteromonas amylolytica]